MKQTKKIVAIAIAIMLTTGTMCSRIVKADTTSAPQTMEQLYNNAYDSVGTEQKEKTQASINVAREAIKALPKSLTATRGEFSKQLDEIQQPIFSNVVGAIVELRNLVNSDVMKLAEQTGIQVKIN